MNPFQEMMYGCMIAAVLWIADELQRQAEGR
jgi:hypothetical protein